MRSLFVTGTDTGVGKTVVTALIALRLRQMGINAGVMKPIASGCCWENGSLVSEDAEWLRAATGVEDDLELINPIRLEEPLAPLVAARRGGQPSGDFLKRSLAGLQELQRRHECVVVEGVGGLLVPIGEQGERLITCVDLANLLALPVVVVAKRGLGTINHTTLTCRTPLEPPARFEGLVFCDASPMGNDVAAATSPQMIEEMTGLPVWGQVPFLSEHSTEALDEAARLLTLPLHSH